MLCRRFIGARLLKVGNSYSPAYAEELVEAKKLASSEVMKFFDYDPEDEWQDNCAIGIVTVICEQGIE